MRWLHRIWVTLVALCAACGAYAHGRQAEFVENLGQWDDNVLYRADIPSGALFLEKNCFTYALLDLEVYRKAHVNHTHLPEHVQGHAFRMTFVNAAAGMEAAGSDRSSHYRNYYLGNDPQKWASHAYSYTELMYTGLYDGVDMRMYSSDGHLKYDLLVAPHADVSVINMHYEGLNGIDIMENGDLRLRTALMDIVERRPVAYQSIGGVQVEVPCAFRLDGSRVTFHFPNGYDPAHALVIDPEIVFASYVGSTANNFGSSATYDNDGNLYGAGTTFGVGYPTTLGAFQEASMGFGGGPCDIGISKFSADGSQLIYSTYLGGTSNETVHSTVVNANNQLYVLGTSTSTNFPVSGNAFQSANNMGNAITWNLGYGIAYPGGCDMVITGFAADGSALIGSTYVGGSGNDGLNVGTILDYNYGDPFRGEINIDATGNVVVASCTESADFPVTAGAAQTTIGGLRDAVVFQMNPNLSQMLWGTFLGGSKNDNAYSVQFTSTGELVVAGGTLSDNFPTTPGVLHPTTNGNADGWVAKLPANGSTIMAATHIGSSAYDQVYFVQIDNNDQIYLLGQTTGTLPLIPATVYANPGSGQFVQKLSNGLDALLVSTTVGTGSGQIDISPTAFMVSICGQIYMSGWGGSTNNANGNTASSSTIGLPITNDAFQSTTNGHDFYLMVLGENASELVYATYFGGNQSLDHVDGGTSRFDKNGVVYQAACAGCGGNDDFPTTAGAWSNTNDDDCNLGVFKFNLNQIVALPEFNIQLNYCIYPLEVIFTNSSSGANTYQWAFGDGATSTSANEVHAYETPGTYDVSLIAMDSTGCLLTDTAYLQFYIPVPPDVTAFGTDTICANETVPLGADAAEGLSYLWRPAHSLDDSELQNPMATPDTTTTYTVTVTDSVGCQSVSDVTVYVAVPEGLDAGADLYMETFNPMQIMAELPPGVTVSWTPAEGLSCTDCHNPVANPEESTMYYVEITDIYGCSSVDSVNVFVYPTLYIPNAFTPDGDIYNHVFHAYGTGIRDFDMLIFNRWGQQIFHSIDLMEGWDGTLNGNPAQQGVYTYLVTYTADIFPEFVKTVVGSVTLTR